MFLVYIVFCCTPFVFVSEGRSVQCILGRNVSFSWTFKNIKRDAIRISRDSSPLLLVWPIKNLTVPHEKDERLRVYVDNSSYETVKVSVSISNIREKDAGRYTLGLQGDSEDFNDSVILQIFDNANLPWITMLRYVTSDSSIELQCNSSSISTGKFAWKLNESRIESHGRYSQNNTILSIKNLKADDKYNLYTCNAMGSGFESDPYKVNIYGPDEIYFNISDNIIQLNELETISLFCSADCLPPCQIGWFETNTKTLIPGSDLKLDGVKNDVNCTCHATNPTNANASISSTIYIKVRSGIKYNTTTSMIQEKDIDDFPTTRYFLYLVIGMGVILAVGSLACLLHKFRACSHVGRASNNMPFANSSNDGGNENLQGELQSGNYWTIVSNAKGELITAIETINAQCNMQTPPSLKEVLKQNNLEHSIGVNDVHVAVESPEYLEPINSDSVALDEYLEPIHSGSVEHDDYIHPVHSGHVETDVVLNHHTTAV